MPIDRMNLFQGSRDANQALGTAIRPFLYGALERKGAIEPVARTETFSLEGNDLQSASGHPLQRDPREAWDRSKDRASKECSELGGLGVIYKWVDRRCGFGIVCLENTQQRLWFFFEQGRTECLVDLRGDGVRLMLESQQRGLVMIRGLANGVDLLLGSQMDPAAEKAIACQKLYGRQNDRRVIEPRTTVL